jgi:hypothetical protein
MKTITSFVGARIVSAFMYGIAFASGILLIIHFREVDIYSPELIVMGSAFTFGFLWDKLVTQRVS